MALSIRSFYLSLLITNIYHVCANSNDSETSVKHSIDVSNVNYSEDLELPVNESKYQAISLSDLDYSINDTENAEVIFGSLNQDNESVINVTSLDGVYSKDEPPIAKEKEVTTEFVPFNPLKLNLPAFQYHNYNPKTEFDASDFCTCNLKLDACDVNCCCDEDCSDADRQVFGECHPFQKTFHDNKYCFKTNIIFINHTIYKYNYTEDGLFCIQYDNNKDIRFYKNVKPVVNLSEFESLYVNKKSKYEEARHITKKMKYGNNVYLLHENGFITKLSYSSSLISRHCEYFQPVSYLHDIESSCILNEDVLKSMIYFPDGKLKFSSQSFKIVKNETAFNLLKIADINHNQQIFSNDSYNDFFIAFNFTCWNANVESTDCSSLNASEVQINAIKYFILHEGTSGIIGGNILLFFEPRIPGNLIKTNFIVEFKWKEKLTVPFKRSGNPGYIFGLPVLAGDLLNVGLDNQTIDIHADSSQWFQIMTNGIDGGSCPNDNNTNARVSVAFGEDIRIACLLELTYQQFLNSECFSEEHMKWILVGKGLPRFIGVFGNSNPKNLEEWVPLINGPERTIVHAKGIDSCFLMNLEIIIAYANVGSISNPQPKIVGAMYSFIKEEIVFDCIGVKCQDNYAKKMQISTNIRFIDVTKSPSSHFSSPPVFKAHLPKDFFYPILSGSSPLKIHDALIFSCAIFSLLKQLFEKNFSMQ